MQFIYNIPMLIIYLRAVETLVIGKLRLIWVTSFGFAQTTILYILKYHIELIETLSLTNATKTKCPLLLLSLFVLKCNAILTAKVLTWWSVMHLCVCLD